MSPVYTAHALARELLKMPDKPVRIACEIVYYDDEDSDPNVVSFDDATDVRYEGSHILIQGNQA